ncbi:MAG: hypothetical protein ABI793_00250 [Flavobacterium sp.]
MKKTILLLIGLIIISCNSQTDLETLKFGTNISSTIEDTKFEKDKNIDFGLVAYVTEDVENFRYGNVNFSNLTINDNTKNSLIKYISNLSIYVDDFKSNNVSGIKIELENESEGEILLNYIKTKLGKPLLENIYNKDNHVQSSYLWDDKKNNQVIYINQQTELYNDPEEKFVSTDITILKKGLKMIPSPDNNPENIKKLLEENPNAFDVLEIFKSYFPN